MTGERQYTLLRGPLPMGKDNSRSIVAYQAQRKEGEHFTEWLEFVRGNEERIIHVLEYSPELEGRKILSESELRAYINAQIERYKNGSQN